MVLLSHTLMNRETLYNMQGRGQGTCGCWTEESNNRVCSSAVRATVAQEVERVDRLPEGCKFDPGFSA